MVTIVFKLYESLIIMQQMREGWKWKSFFLRWLFDKLRVTKQKKDWNGQPDPTKGGTRPKCANDL